MAAAIGIGAAHAQSDPGADVDTAITAYTAGCIGTAPSFETAGAQFETVGLSKIPEGVWVSESQNVIGGVQDDGTCLVMVAAEPAEVLAALNPALKPLLPDAQAEIEKPGEGLTFQYNGAQLSVGVVKSDSLTVIAAQVAADTAPADADTGTDIAPDAKPVSAERAEALFDAICGAALPRFDDAPQLLAANGFNRKSSSGSGTVYSDTENASFQMQDGPDGERICSMVIGSDAPIEKLRAAVMGDDIMESEGTGKSAIYPGSRALIVEGRVSEMGGVTYASFKLRSAVQ